MATISGKVGRPVNYSDDKLILPTYCFYPEGFCISVYIECENECKIILNGEEMEEVNEFKYLGSVMCKHFGME